MVRWLFVLVAALGVLVMPAGADEYWITYEGNDLPENEGWQRFWGNDDGAFEGDGAIRTVEDGILTMDSLYDLRVYDYACHYLYGGLDPEPGDLFVAEWRVYVEAHLGDYYDAIVAVQSDEAWQLSYGLFPDRIESKWEEGVTLYVTPGEFHDYRIESWDMRTYALYIDGELAHEGSFYQGLLESKLGWGDAVRGAANRSHWDYARFGVVPEPRSIVLLTGLFLYVRNGRT